MKLFERKGALDNEEQIQSRIRRFKVIKSQTRLEKDLMNMNCKDILQYYKEFDLHINPLKKHFGMKSYFTRDPEEPKFIFEIFICDHYLNAMISARLLSSRKHESLLVQLYRN